MTTLNELALTIPCPTCLTRPGHRCSTPAGAYTKQPHKARLEPMRAAFQAGAQQPADVEQQPAKPERRKRLREALAKAGRVSRSIIDGFRAEWKLIGGYIAAGAIVFLAFVIVQHYWPDELMAAWGPAWRIGAILGGANLLVLGILELLLRRYENPRDENGNCLICGAGKGEKHREPLAETTRLEVVR